MPRQSTGLGQARLAACEPACTRCRGELYPCETGVRLCEELETGAPRRPTRRAALRDARRLGGRGERRRGRPKPPRGMPVLACVWPEQLRAYTLPYT